MKTLCTSSFAALLAACIATPSANAADCEVLGPCVSIGNIAVMAEDAIADPILSTAQDGAVAFMRYFGVENAPIAIVPGGEVKPAMQEGLKAAGYALSLPWISAADKQLLVQSNIRRQVMEQTKDMPAEQQEVILRMALAKSGADASEPGDMSATEQGALTHELGHFWFMAAFKPARDETDGRHGYGGWAPDWLDETAAILLENETLTKSRRKAFKKMPAEAFYPLNEFLTMEHPSLKSAQALKEKFGNKTGSTGSRAIVLSGEDAQAFLNASGKSDPANFYTQTRGFADYVLEATGDERIFAKLAAHLGGGGTVESWLSSTDGLADTMEGLNRDWAAYLTAR